MIESAVERFLGRPDAGCAGDAPRLSLAAPPISAVGLFLRTREVGIMLPEQDACISTTAHNEGPTTDILDAVCDVLVRTL
jgi:hypothetical protein